MNCKNTQGVDMLIQRGTETSTCNRRAHILAAFRRFFLLALVLAGSLLIGTAVVWAESSTDHRETFRISPAAGEIKVDGELNEAAWERAWTIELRYEVQPAENTPAPVRTVVMLTYDSSFLYAGLRAYDPRPSSIRAHLTDRDGAWSDDWMGIVLDTFNDQKRDYLFVVNPFGVQMDDIEVYPTSNGGTWDGIWDASCRITDYGWSAELKIPFSTLSFPHTDGEQMWGFDAVRGYSRQSFHQMGAFPRNRNNNCYLCQAPQIAGFQGASPGRNIELMPTATAVRTDARPAFPNGDMEKQGSSADFGLTAKWGLTSNMIFNGTINPDFSQVEADALQLDINEAFALSYPEKRPFFMEGSDYFATPLTIIYTRMMQDVDWGTKLSGKEGLNTVGAYIVRDSLTNIIIPGSQGSAWTSLDEPTWDSAFRYKRDLGSTSNIGAVITDREGDQYANRLLGFDGELRLTPQDQLNAQILGSSTRYPDAISTDDDQPHDNFEGAAARAYYRHSSRHFAAVGEYTDVGKGFRADLGFLPQVDYRKFRTATAYEWTPEKPSWYTFIDLEGGGNYSNDQGGDPLLRNAYLNFSYQGPRESHAMLDVRRVSEWYLGKRFNQTQYQLHNCMVPNGSTSYSVTVYWGDRVDYANARLGNRVRTDFTVNERIGRNLKVSLTGSLETMNVETDRLYDARIGTVQIAYQFNPRTFVRLIVQGVRYDHNSELYNTPPDPLYKNVYSQFLFSYKVNPRTVFFVGYSDAREGREEFDLTQRDRTFFIKLGYAWSR